MHAPLFKIIGDSQGPQLVVRTGRLLTLLLKVGPIVILWPLAVNVVVSILIKRYRYISILLSRARLCLVLLL